jgi:hypothetical protein
MNWKHIVAVCVIAAIPSLALAQQKGAAAPKPTKADVAKVVQIISADKAKVKVYCDIGKLQEDAQKLDEKKDAKKLADLDKQIEALAKKLGPEYAKLMQAMQNIDPNSAEGKDLFGAFEPLDKMCTA